MEARGTRTTELFHVATKDRILWDFLCVQLNFIVVRSAVLLAPRVHVRAFRTRRMADAGRPRTRQSLRLIEGFSEINTFLLRRLARVYMGTRPLSKGTFKDRQNAFQGTKLERLALDVSYALVTRLPHLVEIRTLSRRGTEYSRRL